MPINDKRFQLMLQPEALSRWAELQHSLTRMASTIQPSILKIVEEHRRAEEIMRSIKEPVTNSLLGINRLSEALQANNAFQRHLVEIQKASSIVSEFQSASARIAESIKAASAVASFHKYDSLIQSINESKYIYDLSHVAESIRDVSRNLFTSFEPATNAYLTWRESIVSPINNAAFVLPSIPVREQFLTTDLLGSLHEQTFYEDEVTNAREEIVEEVEEHLLLSLPEALNQLDPQLYRLWRGAWNSLTSSNPDKIRHTLTSARELVTQVIHTLSPDEQIEGWSSLEAYYHNGRPTRRARLLFIVSHVEGDSLQTYLHKEVEACLALVDIFQSGTHGIVPTFDDRQLKIILRKVHSMICTLVEIRNGNS